MFTADDRITKCVSLSKINGAVYVPKGMKSDPHTIVPDEVVARCVELYDLAAPGKHGLDPMCGVGTIPRIIMSMGGICDAIEIDAHQYKIAKSELPPGAHIVHGDCLQTPATRTYDYIYTSLPLGWFERPGELRADFAHLFRQLLKPGALLLIDADDITERDGRTWPVAERQIDYFTRNGFRFDESRRFLTRHGQDDCDVTFTELKFVRL